MPNIMDKYTPTYNLESFKHSQYGIKQSALSGAAAMGFERNDIIQAVDSMLPKHFYKAIVPVLPKAKLPLGLSTRREILTRRLLVSYRPHL